MDVARVVEEPEKELFEGAFVAEQDRGGQPREYFDIDEAALYMSKAWHHESVMCVPGVRVGFKSESLLLRTTPHLTETQNLFNISSRMA